MNKILIPYFQHGENYKIPYWIEQGDKEFCPAIKFLFVSADNIYKFNSDFEFEHFCSTNLDEYGFSDGFYIDE